MIEDMTIGYEIHSLIDNFYGYNQIKITLNDQEKNVFTCAWDTICMNVMPLGLKNASSTYQREFTTIFHDMIHKMMEDYVNETLARVHNTTLILKIWDQS